MKTNQVHPAETDVPAGDIGMNVRGAGKDRHARIGEGEIGAEALVRVINHPALRDLPFCLETPNELPGYAEEIRFLKEHRQ